MRNIFFKILLYAIICLTSNISAQNQQAYTKYEGKFLLFDTALKLKPIVDDSVYIELCNLLLKYNDRENEKFDTYENQCLAALLRPISMGGWPYRSWLLSEDGFKQKAVEHFLEKWESNTSSSRKDFYAFCIICPALLAGNVEYPLAVLNEINNKDLADTATLMINNIIFSANLTEEMLPDSMRAFLYSKKELISYMIERNNELRKDPKN